MIDKENILSREFANRVVNFRTDRTIQNELQIIHFQLFKTNFLVNCSPCIKSAYVKIKQELNNPNPIKKTTMKNFELKTGENGMSKQIHVGPDVITNDNLTDEKAIEILKKFPGHRASFKTVPENLEELLGNKKPKAKKEEAKSAPAPKAEKPEAKKAEKKVKAGK